MKANELRIGNYIKLKNSDDIIRVNSIEFNSEAEYCISSLINEEDKTLNIALTEPIPLTKEILLKVGFQKRLIDKEITFVKKVDTYFLNKPITLFAYIQKSNSVTGFRMMQGNRISSTNMLNIFYYHQLQNLIFSLTGEEL